MIQEYLLISCINGETEAGNKSFKKAQIKNSDKETKVLMK